MKTKLLLTAILPLLVALYACNENTVDSAGIKAGDPAAHFTLDSLTEEKEVSMSDFEGKPVVLNFWATWCGPCREEMPLFESSWKEYKDEGVVFLGIDVQDNKDNANQFLTKSGITYPNLYDPSGKVSGKYGVIALPATFFIDKNGSIIAKNYGSFVGGEGKQMLDTYLKELIK